MIAPKINGEFLQDVSKDSHTQIWQCSFNSALVITVLYAEDEGGPCAWGYVEYKKPESTGSTPNRVIFRTDDQEFNYVNPQDVVNILVTYLRELGNTISYVKS